MVTQGLQYRNEAGILNICLTCLLNRELQCNPVFLNSERAIQMNIAIVRTFVRIRELFLKHKDLSDKLDELERKYQLHETDIQVIFQAIKKLLESPPEEPPKPRFGMN